MSDITPENEVFRLAVTTYPQPLPEERLLEAILGPVSTTAQERHQALVGAYAQLSGLSFAEATARVRERADLVTAQYGIALEWILGQMEQQPSPATDLKQLRAAAAQEAVVTKYAELTGLTLREAVGQLFVRAGEIKGRLDRIGSKEMSGLPPEIADTLRKSLQDAAHEQELGKGPDPQIAN